MSYGRTHLLVGHVYGRTSPIGGHALFENMSLAYLQENVFTGRYV